MGPREEVVHFDEGGVLVTDRRIEMPNRTCAVRRVTAVQVMRSLRKSPADGVGLFLFGSAVVVGGLGVGGLIGPAREQLAKLAWAMWAMIAGAVVMAGLALAFLLALRPLRWRVVLWVDGREMVAVDGRSRDFADRLAGAIDRARPR